MGEIPQKLSHMESDWIGYNFETESQSVGTEKGGKMLFKFGMH